MPIFRSGNRMHVPGSDLRRDPQAGVTLIEMLVVLALFAVIAGAVVLSVPDRTPTTGSEVATLAARARLDAAVDRALATGRGFGVWQNGVQFWIVEQQESGNWAPIEDPAINPVKLFQSSPRISLRNDDNDLFAVSAALVPRRMGPLSLRFGGGTDAPSLIFDGLGSVPARPER